MSFVQRLKAALVDDPGVRFIYLNNFEVERLWGRRFLGLPGAALGFSDALVHRMEEVGVPLAEASDVVLLKSAVDGDFLSYLRSVGCAEGEVLPVDDPRPDRTVTRDALASPRTLDRLRALADGATYLMPLGVSEDEEELSRLTGIPLASPGSPVHVAVNGKVFSRRLVDELGLTPVPGHACETLEEVRAAMDALLDEGGQVAVKESLGVSGRGLVVVDERRRADRLLRMLERRTDGRQVAFVVERWIRKRLDLNYQFIVGRRGEVCFENVKAALVREGVHRGHAFPVPLEAETERRLRDASQLLGKRLAEEGYHGVVGVDALVGDDGTLYPCLEINARFNMSTYQNGLAERLIGPDRHAVATALTFRLRRPFGFGEILDALGELAYLTGPGGILVNGFATLNAMAGSGTSFTGRLYAVCIADDARTAADLRDEGERRLVDLVTP
jgi:Pre ATP-grasp domain/ATP-grasp domain